MAGAIPSAVTALLERLWTAGRGAYVVGGSLRDILLGLVPHDWDVATSAHPEQTAALFPGAVYENRFGTVAVRLGDEADTIQVTTFRSDHDYADFRRPHRIEFGDTIELDLARRDFTINAIAWGRPGDPVDADAAPGHAGLRLEPGLIDPYDGRADVASRTLRAVGDPSARFQEDALRLVRAVRFAATLEVTIEPATRDAIDRSAALVGHLSGERLAMELRRLLAAERPSIGLRLLQETGLLAYISPELAAQRGVPQAKVPGEDLWDHTVRAVDGAASQPPYLRLAALLHDVGKPATFADGRFLQHETVGAQMARALLDRLRWPHDERDRIVRLVRQHMFGYQSAWSDAAVRRFIATVGVDLLDDLFELRAADSIGSGRDAASGGLDELRSRVAAQLDADPALDLGSLAVRGDDLIRELHLSEGPDVGRLLDGLLQQVISDPARNRRSTLIAAAREMLGQAPAR